MLDRDKVGKLTRAEDGDVYTYESPYTSQYPLGIERDTTGRGGFWIANNAHTHIAEKDVEKVIKAIRDVAARKCTNCDGTGRERPPW